MLNYSSVFICFRKSSNKGKLVNIFSPEGFHKHSLQEVVGLQPFSEADRNSVRQDLESKAIAFDHLTYILLTQNRWLSP